MRVVFTIYYSLDEDLYIIYDDSYNSRSNFSVGYYSYLNNSYLIYFIIYVTYYNFKKIYVGSELYYIQYLITDDYRKYVDKHTKKSLKIKKYVKSKLVNVLIHLLNRLGYSPKK